MDNCFQTMVVEEQKRLTLTKVSSVDAFTEQKIRLTVKTGKVLIVGEGLKINGFMESTGAFSCEGRIDGITFSQKKEGLVKRIFK